MDLRNRPVSEIMRREVVTLAEGDSLAVGDDVMRLGRVRHLPVVSEDGRLVGLVSNRDLLEASLSKAIDFDAASRRSFLSSVDVAEVMTRDVATVGPDATLEEAASLLLARRIGCLPVVDENGVLRGLVTETDLLSAALVARPPAAETERSSQMNESRGVLEWIEEELEDLRQMRDELNVQSHLARAELRDTWQDLEEGFSELERRAKQAASAAEPALKQLGADARKLVEDLREGYRRIRKSI